MKISAKGLGDFGKVITLLGFALFIWSAGWLPSLALLLMWLGRFTYENKYDIILRAASIEAAKSMENHK